MPKLDPRIDAYIAQAAEFARPILTEVRRRMHAAVKDVEETIKWNVPFFLADGNIVLSMAAFKQHAKVLVWPGTMKAKPSSVDVKTVSELPTPAEFTKNVKAAVSACAAGAAKKAAAKDKSAAKASPATKSAPTRKAGAAKRTAARKPSRRTAAKPGK